MNKLNSLRDENKNLKKKNSIYSKDYLTNLLSSCEPHATKDGIMIFIESFKEIDTNEIKLLSDIAKSKNDKCISFFIVP